MFTFVQSLASKTVQKAFFGGASNKKCPPHNNPKDGGYKVYKYMTFFVGLPAILAVAAFTFIQKKNRDDCAERPPFVPYESMRRRTKRFPWGDGNKSFFHNPVVNALPEGYEEECVIECDGEDPESDC